MLQNLDRQKLIAAKLSKNEQINHFFEEIGKPKKWKNSDGRINLVVTPFTTTACELNLLFQKLHDYSLDVVRSLG